MSTKDVEARPSSNWRDPSSYAYTRRLTRDGWAWEFLRRNRAYAELAGSQQPAIRRSWRHRSAISVIDVAGSSGDASTWGLHFLRSRRPPR